eukprot:6182214-Pleurochrysis_carterae.AAC.1
MSRRGWGRRRTEALHARKSVVAADNAHEDSAPCPLSSTFVCRRGTPYSSRSHPSIDPCIACHFDHASCVFFVFMIPPCFLQHLPF